MITYTFLFNLHGNILLNSYLNTTIKIHTSRFTNDSLLHYHRPLRTKYHLIRFIQCPIAYALRRRNAQPKQGGITRWHCREYKLTFNRHLAAGVSEIFKRALIHGAVIFCDVRDDHWCLIFTRLDSGSLVGNNLLAVFEPFRLATLPPGADLKNQTTVSLADEHGLLQWCGDLGGLRVSWRIS